MNDCIFCKIVAGEIPSQKVYEDDQTLAILDVNPINIGHTLIMPKEHFVNLYTTPDESLAHMAPIMKELSIAIKKSMNADGVNIEMNNDDIAGQLVFHTHIHIVPRFAGDGFRHWHGARPYREGEMAEVRGKIAEALK